MSNVEEQEKQIEILATKIMGWKPRGLYPEDKGRVWVGSIGTIRTAHHDWNPFENPADCELLKAKLVEMGFLVGIEQYDDADDCIGVIELRKVCGGVDSKQEEHLRTYRKGEAKASTECKALSLATLQLSQCKGRIK